MASELADILKRVSALDHSVGDELRRQIDDLTKRRANGLNFERHLPEQVALVGRPISIGDKVRFIPVRGSTDVDSTATWVVTKLTGPNNKRVAELYDAATGETARRAVDDLVFVADFRDPIYPGLKSTGRVERGGPDKPFHTVINSENYHALEALLFTHAGQVDCIYIDPPYNSGAKDWKYNNDYVDEQDAYRHSKWLSFMERRLKIAKKLLNPADSVLIVTIDEKEYLRLGLLLEQTFPGAAVQMVSSQINPAASSRAGAFGRVDEYIFFVRFGAAVAQRLSLGREWVSTKGRTHTGLPRWDMLRRSGEGARRQDSPGGFYPVYVDPSGPRVVKVGAPLPAGVSVPEHVDGAIAVLPIRKDGSEGRWMWKPSEFERRLAQGRVRISGSESAGYVVSVLKDGEYAKILNGEFEVLGRDVDNSMVFERAEGDTVRAIPGTQWRITSHDATQYGSRLLKDSFLPGRDFPFPKSLYAVEDTLRFFVADKPDALILDFFSGSGTTAHAVMRLNKLNGGRRRSISVTNNEVSAEEEAALMQRGLRPGDAEWEALGICDYVTKPRIASAITGHVHGNVDQAKVEGRYKRSVTTSYELRHEGECTNIKSKLKKDGSLPKCRKTHRPHSITTFEEESPMSDGFDENVEFFTLTYLNPQLVELDMAFASIAPLLWMRAGAQGRRIDERTDTFDVADTYAVLFELDQSSAFIDAVDQADGLRVAYIVTDDEPQFQAVAAQLPEGIKAVRLYESYLRTFQINTERA